MKLKCLNHEETTFTYNSFAVSKKMKLILECLYQSLLCDSGEEEFETIVIKHKKNKFKVDMKKLKKLIRGFKKDECNSF